jgi:hypothetical protein
VADRLLHTDRTTVFPRAYSLVEEDMELLNKLFTEAAPHRLP